MLNTIERSFMVQQQTDRQTDRLHFFQKFYIQQCSESKLDCNKTSSSSLCVMCRILMIILKSSKTCCCTLLYNSAALLCSLSLSSFFAQRSLKNCSVQLLLQSRLLLLFLPSDQANILKSSRYNSLLLLLLLLHNSSRNKKKMKMKNLTWQQQARVSGCCTRK